MAPLHVMAFVVALVALVQGAEEAASTYGAQDIFAAVKLDSMSAIKQALADGADINQRQPESGQTPLSECTNRTRAHALPDRCNHGVLACGTLSILTQCS
jgi:hypothetical protein